MGRKSREKANRLRSGDIFEHLENLPFFPKGFYKVTAVYGQYIRFSIGSLQGGSSRRNIGSYRKVDPTTRRIDWDSERLKYEAFYRQCLDPSLWREVHEAPLTPLIPGFTISVRERQVA